MDVSSDHESLLRHPQERELEREPPHELTCGDGSLRGPIVHGSDGITEESVPSIAAPGPSVNVIVCFGVITILGCPRHSSLSGSW